MAFMELVADILPSGAVNVEPDSFSEPAAGSVSIRTALIASPAFGSVYPKSAAVNVYVASSFIVMALFAPDGASFWTEVYEPFMARDLTRHEVRELIRLGLEHTRGNYKMLVTSFNMPPEDYKKFLNFLRKYQCHVPFQRFRMMPAGLQGRSPQVASA